MGSWEIPETRGRTGSQVCCGELGGSFTETEHIIWVQIKLQLALHWVTPDHGL